MYSQNQTRAAQAAKSFTPYDHILHFFLENPLLFGHIYAKRPERIDFFSSTAIISAQVCQYVKVLSLFFPDVQKK